MPLHLIFECEALKWDRENLFGQYWPTPCNRPALASPRQNKGSNDMAQANRLKACDPILNPANIALAGMVSQVRNSSFNVPHPLSFLNSWTIKQILEFVSVDSLLEVYVPQHIGESGLNYNTASPVVHAAQI